MRRKDRILSNNEAFEILDNCEYAVISCLDDNKIFSIPISIVRQDLSIFIHGAKGGTKNKLFKDGKEVELVAVSYNKVPTPSIEFCENIKHEHDKLGSFVFTTEYKSVIAKTRAYKILDDLIKLKALEILCKKYTPNYMNYFHVAANGALKHTNIYELKIQSISAKAKIINKAL